MKPLLALTLFSFLYACGPVSKKIKIEIQTGLAVKKQIEPREFFSQKLFFAPGTICEQRNLIYGFDPSGTGKGPLITKPVKMNTTLSSTGPGISTSASYLDPSVSALTESLNLTLERGRSVLIFIMGAAYFDGHLGTDTLDQANECLSTRDNANILRPMASYSFFGTKTIIPFDSQPIQITAHYFNRLQATSAFATDPSPCSLPHSGPPRQECRQENFLKVVWNSSTCSSGGGLLDATVVYEVPFIASRDPSKPLIHQLSANSLPAAPSSWVIPNYPRFRIHYHLNGAPGVDRTETFTCCDDAPGNCNDYTNQEAQYLHSSSNPYTFSNSGLSGLPIGCFSVVKI